jgi:hypothetical protein
MSGFIGVRARLAQAVAVLTGNYERTDVPVANEFKELIVAGYNWLGRYLSLAEVNPLSQQYVEQNLVAALSLGAGTTYYPSSAGMAMGGFKDLGTALLLVAGAVGAANSITVTLETSNDTTNPPGTWVDVSVAGYDLGLNVYGIASWAAAAGATTTKILDWDNLNCRRFRFKVVVVLDGANPNNSTLTLWTRHKAL